LFITRDTNPFLIVPNDSKEYTRASAHRLGLNLKERLVDAEWEPATDRLEVYDEKGNLLFTHRAFLDIIRESETSFNALHLRRLAISSEEVYPVDAEGMEKKGQFIHFNRESYLVNPHDFAGIPFGSIMHDPIVFQTVFKNGMPIVYTPEYQKPFKGPDGVDVIDPHVWAPDNQIARYFDALGVKGYNWIAMELWKERLKLKGQSLLPDDVLSKE